MRAAVFLRNQGPIRNPVAKASFRAVLHAALLLLLLMWVGSFFSLAAQCLSAGPPTKEYVRIGERTLAIENAALPVSVNPFAVTLADGQSRQFSAVVTGSTNQGVTWSISSAVGTIEPTGLYHAPQTVETWQILIVTATSVADTSKTACATITLSPPIAVSITPNLVTSLQSGQTQQFTASVSNAFWQAVNWTITPPIGSIDQTGLYTAPNPETYVGNVTVIATSAADTSKSGSATVVFHPIGVAVTPANVNLQAGQAQSFSATVGNSSNQSVVWSISPIAGSINQSGLYQAPATYDEFGPHTVSVIATSAADSSKTGTGTVTLSAPPVGGGSLPPGWVNHPVGSGSSNNSATYLNGVYTLSSTSGGIGGSDDNGYEYVTQQVDAYGVMQARTWSGQSNSNSLFGIVIRNTNTDSDTPEAFVGLQPSTNTLRFSWRVDPGAGLQTVGGPSVQGPIWLRLLKNGNSLGGYYSLNGMDWLQIGSTQTINLASRVYVGMAVIADCCNQGASASALFDNVWVNAAPDFYPIPIPAVWASSIAGDVGHYQIGVGGLDGFNGLIGLSVSGLPAGATASISPQIIATQQIADIAVQVPSGTAVGTYALTINATGGGQTHSVPVQLNVVNGHRVRCLPAG